MPINSYIVKLPNALSALKALIASQQRQYQQKIKDLEGRIRLLQNELFGRK